jgi:hypothetical protein
VAADGDVIERMRVATRVPRDEWSRRVARHHSHFFQRFVRLLGERGRVVKSIQFESVEFVTRIDVPPASDNEHDDDDASSNRNRNHNENETDVDTIRREDLEELFGSTLPRHATLETIAFEGCYIPEALFERFVRVVAARG